jgi:hypothetical protein
MSIGNLKTEGNKGNNFPFQLKVLQGLQSIAANTSDSLTCCSDTGATLKDIATALQGAERTPGVLSTTTSGTTPIGAYSVSIANVGSAAGVVNAQSIPAGTTLNFDGGVLNNTISPLVYNATGTTFIITWLE